MYIHFLSPIRLTQIKFTTKNHVHSFSISHKHDADEVHHLKSCTSILWNSFDYPTKQILIMIWRTLFWWKKQTVQKYSRKLLKHASVHCKVYGKNFPGGKKRNAWNIIWNLHYVKIQVVSSYTWGPTTWNLKSHLKQKWSAHCHLI